MTVQPLTGFKSLLTHHCVTGETRLMESAAEFKRIGDAWEAFADWAKASSEAPDSGSCLPEATDPLNNIADQEQAAWNTLYKTCS